MKITGMNPQIITKDPEAVIAAFEALGFVRTHNKTGEEDVIFSVVRMKRESDKEGSFHVDVLTANVPGFDLSQDRTTIRINVDDFDAAYQLPTDKGFKAIPGIGSTTPSSRYAYMKSPSGFTIDLCQHIKK